MKVRISKKPDVEEMDGVRLDDMQPGTVHEVSPSIGSWLIAERCAEPEMRREYHAHEEDFLSVRRATADEISGGRRRWSDQR